MRWAAFGTYDVTRHPRVAVLIEGLREAGDEVVEVNEPLRLDTAGRVAMLRQPWRLPLLGAKLLRCWFTLYRRSRRLGGVDAILVGYLGHFDVRLASRLFPKAPVVLDHLVSAAGVAADRDLAGSGVKQRLLRAIDRGALGSASVVVVDTAEHLAALPAQVRERGVVVPVGATEEWFAAGRGHLDLGNVDPAGGVESSKIEPLRVIFVGVFTPLHGTPTLGAALALLADTDVEVTMVGTGQDHAACRKAAEVNRRVRWVEWVPSTDLPSLVAQHDVSLGIFGTTPKALNVVPTKVYQGAAAGCAIVTSDTPPQRAALQEAALFVPPGDPVALADALRSLTRTSARQLGLAAHELATESYTPAAVVAPIRTFLKEVA